MKVSVVDDAMKVDWIDPTWEAWSELQQAEEYVELVRSSNQRLTQAAEHKKKGIGKGSKGIGQQ